MCIILNLTPYLFYFFQEFGLLTSSKQSRESEEATSFSSRGEYVAILKKVHSFELKILSPDCDVSFCAPAAHNKHLEFLSQIRYTAVIEILNQSILNNHLGGGLAFVRYIFSSFAGIVTHQEHLQRPTQIQERHPDDRLLLHLLWVRNLKPVTRTQ